MSRSWLKFGLLAGAVVILLVVAVVLVRGAGTGTGDVGEVAATPPAGPSATAEPSDPAPSSAPASPAAPEPTDGGPEPAPGSTPPPGGSEDDPAEEPADPEPTPPAPGMEVPAGTVDEVVDDRLAGPTVEAEADSAELDGGITVRLAGAALQQVEAVGPGETSGTAVVVDLELTNQTDDPVGLDAAVVTLLDGADQIGLPGTGEPYSPFSGAVAPGDTAEASYVFRVTEGAQDEPFSLSVTHMPGAPTVVITGTAD
ncbi:hypothetical protein DT076_08690 [Desertihabitans brevis]|uniref:DUF4352 domain-containing protein n=1 Tax=Desertihabitans brevis TaxID=2268447 RepID=A0A367YYH0_9ACTN|nr:hypothetical protein [Desertihabitans brevis]RCK70062.1 hypothetical protein DT076_08690 [Desertihabitans brevis]